MSDTNSEPGIREYLKLLKRRWIWIFVPVLLLTAAAGWQNLRQTPNYRATARVLVAPSAAEEAVDGRQNLNAGLRSRELGNEINIANSDETRDVVRQSLGLAAEDPLPTGSITPDTQSDLLTFRFEGNTADHAAEIANAWAISFVSVKQAAAKEALANAVDQLVEQQQQLRDQRVEVRQVLTALEDQLVKASSDEERATLVLQIERERSLISGDVNLVDSQINAATDSITQLQLSSQLAAGGTASVVQRAVAPLRATNTSLWRSLAVGIFIGAIGGLGLAMLIDNLDRSIRTLDDLQILGVPLLGAIPSATYRQKTLGLDTISQTDPGSPMADAYHRVRSALEFSTIDRDIKSILVTSPHPNDGKTTTAVNLALSYATVHRKVALADADFRRPTLHLVFGTEQSPGITDALVRESTLIESAVHLPASASQLVAIPAGREPPSPTALLSSPAFAALLTDLKLATDLTIFDSPPVLPVADALSLCPIVDGVIVVANARRTSVDELKAAVDLITKSGGTVLGVILNATRATVRSSEYHNEGRRARRRRERRRPRPPTKGATPSVGSPPTEAPPTTAEPAEAPKTEASPTTAEPAEAPKTGGSTTTAEPAETPAAEVLDAATSTIELPVGEFQSIEKRD